MWNTRTQFVGVQSKWLYLNFSGARLLSSGFIFIAVSLLTFSSPLKLLFHK